MNVASSMLKEEKILWELWTKHNSKFCEILDQVEVGIAGMGGGSTSVKELHRMGSVAPQRFEKNAANELGV